MAAFEASDCTTISYKRLPSGKEVLLDFYPPGPETSGDASPIKTIPAIVFFHGGNLILGNRRLFFPAWLKSTCTFDTNLIEFEFFLSVIQNVQIRWVTHLFLLTISSCYPVPDMISWKIFKMSSSSSRKIILRTRRQPSRSILRKSLSLVEAQEDF